MPKIKGFCYKKYPFFEIPRPEDLSSPTPKSFKEMLRSVSPFKKIPLAECETFTRKQELDYPYWRSLLHEIESDSNRNSADPAMTEEMLYNWIKQSLNLKFKKVPAQRPLMLSPKIYNYLREVECKTNKGGLITVGTSERRVKTLDEINREISRERIHVRDLTPKYVRGQRFRSPRSSKNIIESAESLRNYSNEKEKNKKYFNTSNENTSRSISLKRITRKDTGGFNRRTLFETNL
ncbi:unnamed protein product [Blepharisma stoltei]|uniref:Uncharacterized protein n=1 Tax=Blepharisma stoltei TaxID=1481888 RepID=A0AAU9K6T2_9CILI|nr:unnamed protein product [Blepharisma stoltei]